MSGMDEYAPVVNKSPAPLATARARHRRVQLPCDTDLMAQLLALLEEHTMPGLDRRHETATAYRHLEAWIVWLDLENKSARTLNTYERNIAPLLRTHPAKTVAEFTPEDINNELRLVPPRSRYIPRSIYNSWFGWLHRHDHIEKNPMVKVPKITAGNRRHKDIFEPADIAKLETLPLPDGQLFTILFGTGIRGGEARALQRKHINLERSRLVVYGGKGDKDRVIPFGATVTMAIADLDLLERLNPDDHLWHRKRYPVGDPRRRRDPIGSTTFSRWYADMLDQAGVRYLNPHQTRHTYHWRLRHEGELSLEDRQFLMGHSSPETTVRQYGRNDVEAIAAKVAAL